jgi:excisionase family DNA binding protein
MGNRSEKLATGTTLYSIATVAERLDISQDTVRRLIGRGVLAAIHIGSSVRIDAAELEAFIVKQRRSSQRRQAAPPPGGGSDE